MKKIFLDIGAYNGVSAKFFLDNHPQSNEFEIFSFECDNRNINTIKSLNLPIVLIEKAVWCSTGIEKYYYGKDDGGSLYGTKKTGGINPDTYYSVPCIDIAEFMKNNFSKDDYIIMKLNCEGAEYDIIFRLYEQGMLDWIDMWFVQWHYDKIGLDKDRHIVIASLIPKYYQWDCQGGNPEFINYFKQAINENNTLSNNGE